MRTVDQEHAAYNGLSPARLAERWDCTPAHVVNLIKAGRLRAIDIGAGSRPEYRVKPEWVEEFETTREVRSDG